MAVTTAQARNQGLKFRNDIIREYVRGNMFSPYMGDVWQFLASCGIR